MAGELAAHNYRFDEAVDARRARRWRSTPNNAARARRPRRRICCARATSPRRVRRSKPSFKLDPFDVVTLNLLRLMDTLDKFVTVRDGDLDLRS